MAGAVGLFVGVSTGGCATISGNSRLTGLRSHFGHWLCSRQHGTDSGGVDLAPERAGCACSNLFACSMSEQTNKQLLYSERDTRRTFGGQGRPHFVLPLRGTRCCDNIHKYSNVGGLVVLWV